MRVLWREPLDEIRTASLQLRNLTLDPDNLIQHDLRVTRQIYALMDQAQKDSDYIAQRFLDWFVNEQFEEMSTMGDLLQVVERAGEDQLLRVEEYLERGGPEGPSGEEE